MDQKEIRKKGYPGHQEIELALVKLYRVTNDKKYLELSRFFLMQRGKDPHYFEIEQKKFEKKIPWKILYASAINK